MMPSDCRRRQASECGPWPPRRRSVGGLGSLGEVYIPDRSLEKPLYGDPARGGGPHRSVPGRGIVGPVRSRRAFRLIPALLIGTRSVGAGTIYVLDAKRLMLGTGFLERGDCARPRSSALVRWRAVWMVTSCTYVGVQTGHAPCCPGACPAQSGDRYSLPPRGCRQFP
jgi:hypothetical protein